MSCCVEEPKNDWEEDLDRQDLQVTRERAWRWKQMAANEAQGKR